MSRLSKEINITKIFIKFCSISSGLNRSNFYGPSAYVFLRRAKPNPTSKPKSYPALFR